MKRTVLSALALAGFVYAAAWTDSWLRARTAYLEGEKYMRWNEEPALRKAAAEADFGADKARLDEERAAGRMDDLEHSQRLALAAFKRDEAAAESPLKLAYRWFETGADLFSTPDNRWARRSRERMAEAGRLWRRELEARGLPAAERLPR